MKTSFWLALVGFGLTVEPLAAQLLPDSIQITKAVWRTNRLNKRVVWKEAHFDSLFRAKQQLNIIQIRPHRRKVRLAFASAGDSLKPTSWFAQREDALAVVNGTFFDVKNGGSVDYIKVNNQLFDTTRYTAGKQLAEHQQSAILIQNNQVQIVFGGNTPGWERALTAENIMVTGPLLLKNGGRHRLLKNAFNDNRHPRTCACITDQKEIILLTADGRNANAAGLNLHELASVMKWLGCRDAINFDGGGSTTMWIRGQPENGVVNYPSDSKQWIHTGERPVSNVMLVK